MQVTIQYIAPMILIMFLTLMYKTMGGGSWMGLWTEGAAEEPFPEDESPADRTHMDKAAEAVGENFSLAWQSLKQVRTMYNMLNKKPCVKKAIAATVAQFFFVVVPDLHAFSLSRPARILDLVVLPGLVRVVGLRHPVPVLLCKSLKRKTDQGSACPKS